jgi:hypothetical protein
MQAYFYLMYYIQGFSSSRQVVKVDNWGVLPMKTNLHKYPKSGMTGESIGKQYRLELPATFGNYLCVQFH